MSTIVATLFGGSCAAKLHHSSARVLTAMAVQLAADTRAQTLEELRSRLASSSSETANLRAGCDACLALFPGAVACAFGAFAEGTSCDVVATLECGAHDAASRAALAAALPAHVGADRMSSVARACGATAGDGCALLDSRELPLGLGACADWQRVITAAGGMQSSAAITAPVCAGPVLVGFLTVHFGLFDSSAPGSGDIRELCDAIGGAVFVRRAFSTNQEAFNAGLYAAGVPDSGDDGGAAPARYRAPGRNTSPSGRRSSLFSDGGARTPNGSRLLPRGFLFRNSSSSMPQEDVEHVAALAALDASAAADWVLLLDWGLDAEALPLAEACRLLSAMMHSLGLLQRFHISAPAFEAFIQDVERHYHAENPFHHFGHAFKVAHTSWMFLAATDVRNERGLDSVHALALMLSAICHDLEHEGVTNSYQVNSCSPLSRLYNDASVNENNHCAVGFELLDGAGILDELDAGEKKTLRKLMVAAIMATDSACFVCLPAWPHTPALAFADALHRCPRCASSCAAQWRATKTWCSA
jgi:hypothetical protein